MCRLQLRAAVIFISVISPASPIGMCAQLSLFSTFWRACWRGPGVGAGAQRGVDDLVAERRAASGVERYEVLSGA